MTVFAILTVPGLAPKAPWIFQGNTPERSFMTIPPLYDFPHGSSARPLVMPASDDVIPATPVIRGAGTVAIDSAIRESEATCGLGAKPAMRELHAAPIGEAIRIETAALRFILAYFASSILSDI
jgi:hypothetical protein